MAATSNYMAYTTFSMLGYRTNSSTKEVKKRSLFTVSAQETDVQEVEQQQQTEPQGAVQEETLKQKQQSAAAGPSTPLRPVDKQVNVRSRNMSPVFGSEWLSSTTRHVRIFAAYIDPETCAFDQKQTDKLTLILDPTEEFVWTDETCNKVYSYFQELVDHYEGAPLTEYTLRLIGSDIEHYIRKLLYQGEIQYNMNARVLNFSMGKPRIGFSYNGELEDVK